MSPEMRSPEPKQTIRVEEFGVAPGLYPVTIVDLPSLRMAGDKPLVSFPIQIDEGPEEGHMDKVDVFARSGKLEEVLSLLGVSYTKEGKSIVFAPEDCVGMQAKALFQEKPGKVMGQKFVNAVELLPRETESGEVL